MTEQKKHSRVGASSAKRFLNCPGSVELSKNIPEQTSVFAKEGQNAHAFAEYCLSSNLKPSAMTPAIQSHVESLLGFKIDAEMIRGIQVYIDLIDEIKAKSPKAKWEVEKRFHLDFIDKEAFGTCDFVLYEDFGTLRVVDLKYGAGVFVDVIDNEQLIYYAIGAAWDTQRNAFHDFEDVELTIVQPRASGGPFRKYKFPAKELEKWAKIFSDGIKATRIPGAPLKDGEWCQFCPAKPQCPQLHSKALEVLSHDFETAELLTDEKVRALIENKGTIESFLKKVYEMALMRAANGNPIPGTKLVRGRGKRVWADEKDAELKFQALVGADAYDVSLKTPPAMEKVSGVKKGDVNPMTVTVEGKLTLVSESDARPAVESFEIDFQKEFDL